MRAVVTVVGRDMVGILAKVAGECAKVNANVIEVNQSVLQDMFAMIMLTDISGMTQDFSALVDEMDQLGKELGLQALGLFDMGQLQQRRLADQLVSGCINVAHNQIPPQILSCGSWRGQAFRQNTRQHRKSV